MAQTIPTYSMSVFKLPFDFCAELQQMVANYWWSHSSSSKGFQWLQWRLLCPPKSEGGMGFRDLIAFNQALLAKQCWRIVLQPFSLVAKVLKARYFPNSGFLESKLTNNSSYILRSLLWGRKILKIGSRWLVGEGKDILVYYHNWIPRPCTFRPASPHTLPSDTTVATLLKENGGWNEELIRTHFLPVDIAAILKILVPTVPLRDELLWHFNQSGVYSVKSGYQVAFRLRFPDIPSCSESFGSWWKFLWHLPGLPKMIFFFFLESLKRHSPHPI